ncbi:hypothetical protein BHE74_00043573 [Ensete ventricosum]|nr:hypothetical protein BHE74_00043573 [Ensete ventricosum]RZR89618.1 hypothetical protein BHM03_00017371 [Ensete ventricosum]
MGEVRGGDTGPGEEEPGLARDLRHRRGGGAGVRQRRPPVPRFQGQDQLPPPGLLPVPRQPQKPEQHGGVLRQGSHRTAAQDPAPALARPQYSPPWRRRRRRLQAVSLPAIPDRRHHHSAGRQIGKSGCDQSPPPPHAVSTHDRR